MLTPLFDPTLHCAKFGVKTSVNEAVTVGFRRTIKLQEDQTVLRPGMVATLERTIQFSREGDIFVCLEDQFLITEDGFEWLTSEASLELFL